VFVKIFCAVGIYTRGNVEILWSRYMENTFYVGHILKRIIPSVIKCHMPSSSEAAIYINLSRYLSLRKSCLKNISQFQKTARVDGLL